MKNRFSINNKILILAAFTAIALFFLAGCGIAHGPYGRGYYGYGHNANGSYYRGCGPAGQWRSHWATPRQGYPPGTNQAQHYR